MTATRFTRNVVGGAMRNAIHGPSLAIANRDAFARKDTPARTMDVVWTSVSAADLSRIVLVISQMRFINRLVCVARRSAKNNLVVVANPDASAKRDILELMESVSSPRNVRSVSVELINHTGVSHIVKRGVIRIV